MTPGPRNWQQATMKQAMTSSMSSRTAFSSVEDDAEPDRAYPYLEVLNAFRRDGRLLLPAHDQMS